MSLVPLARPKFRGHVLGELSALVAGGALLGFFFGIAQSSNRWSAALLAVVIALASAAVGGLVGLLFGVPRALANAGPPPSSPTNAAPSAQTTTAGTQPKSGGYAGNTNLEQVSDWLTKLLLGAGLTQLGRVPGTLDHLGNFLAPGLGGHRTASFAITLVLFNLVVGFALGFLWARLKLGAAFKEADDLATEATEVSSTLDTLPPAPVDPTMLLAKDQPSPEKQRLAQELAQQVQRIEQATPSPAFTPEEYRRLAQELVAQQLYHRALNILELGMQQHPDDPSLVLYAGAINGIYLQEYSSAEAYYRQALALNPHYAPAYYNLACTSARRGDSASAAAYLRLAYSLDPKLRQTAIKDPLWAELDLRDSPELADLLRIDSPPKA